MIVIPAWVITVLAFSAALALSGVKSMPHLTRISISVPLVYFGILYIFVGYEAFEEPTKAFLVRLGLVVLFLPILWNSVPFLIQRYRCRKKL